MNHYQFTGDNGPPPAAIAANDFRAEVSNADAVSTLAGVISAFVSQSLGVEVRQSERDLIKKVADATRELLDPIVEAFLLEGTISTDKILSMDVQLTFFKLIGGCERSLSY